MELVDHAIERLQQSMNNLDNLDNKRMSIIPGQNKIGSEQYDVPVQEVYKQKLQDLKFAKK